MSEISCPYCGKSQDISHDQEFEDGELFELECDSCEKNFVYTVAISFHYESAEADCLNGSEHTFEWTKTYPIKYSRMRCVDCGLERQPTVPEWDMFGRGAR